MRSALVNRLYCAVCAVFVGVVSTLPVDFLQSSAPGTSFGSSGSPGKILTYTGMIVSTELPNLLQLPRIDDCVEIHILHWDFGDHLLLNHPFFRSGHHCTSTSSAITPCYFRLQADITTWVLRKVRIHTVLTQTWFHFCSRLHWKFMRRTGSVLTSSLWVSPRLGWSNFINQFLWIPVGKSGNSCEKSLCTSCDSPFSFLFLVSMVSCSGSPFDIKYGILWWWWRSKWRCGWGRTRW